MQRLSPRFNSQQLLLCKICGENVLLIFIVICMEMPYPHAGAHLDGLQHGGRKPAETPVTEFCYKSVKFSLQEFKNIKMIFF